MSSQPIVANERRWLSGTVSAGVLTALAAALKAAGVSWWGGAKVYLSALALMVLKALADKFRAELKDWVEKDLPKLVSDLASSGWASLRASFQRALWRRKLVATQITSLGSQSSCKQGVVCPYLRESPCRHLFVPYQPNQLASTAMSKKSRQGSVLQRQLMDDYRLRPERILAVIEGCDIGVARVVDCIRRATVKTLKSNRWAYAFPVALTVIFAPGATPVALAELPELMVKDYQSNGGRGDPLPACTRLIEEGPVMIAVHGMDALDDEAADRAVRWLEAQARANPGVKFVLAVRGVTWARHRLSIPALAYELLPPDERDLFADFGDAHDRA